MQNLFHLEIYRSFISRHWVKIWVGQALKRAVGFKRRRYLRSTELEQDVHQLDLIEASR